MVLFLLLPVLLLQLMLPFLLLLFMTLLILLVIVVVIILLLGILFLLHSSSQLLFVPASGFQTGIKRKSAEDDGDLNIDGDDSEEYGKPQYPLQCLLTDCSK